MSGLVAAGEEGDLTMVASTPAGEILETLGAAFYEDTDGQQRWYVYYPAPSAGDYVIKLTREGCLTKAYAVHIDGALRIVPTFAPYFGDLTGDNKIDAVDLGIANRIVGKHEFDDTMEPNDWEYFHLLDRDFDGYVSVAEAAPVTDNQGRIGE